MGKILHFDRETAKKCLPLGKFRQEFGTGAKNDSLRLPWGKWREREKKEWEKSLKILYFLLYRGGKLWYSIWA